ncbi:MAG: GNAT family N-acetyltransferase [Gordonia sp. (in: high G+C Gram-positive bacteria)]|uniref:GNAT family N-acetyltransferase n=1 Tax=Gordonia sp. (in: high G+C Gram-positive bacteria) TaxID=84139 RepID=UPI0039E44335
MSVRLVSLPAADAHIWLDPAVYTYVTAMNYPRGTEHTRAALWRDHIRRPGWSAVAAISSASAMDVLRPAYSRLHVHAPWAPGDRDVLVGVAYGYTGRPDQWWNRQLRNGLRQAGRTPAQIAAVADDYFELTELHVHPMAQGRGIGEALLTRLLAGRPESAVLLSTPEVPGEENRAWSLYRRLGFVDVLRDYGFAGDPRPFAFLGRRLPLSASPVPRQSPLTR